VADARDEVIERRLEVLASLPLEDREQAWR